MNVINMQNLDWSLIQTFLAVAEHGSFTAAARLTGISQPTIGRHIQALEQQLNTPVFQRKNSGHQLTDAGTQLLEQARVMEEAAARMHLMAAGQSDGLSGTVRISASVVVSHYLLPEIFARIRAAEPQIELELHPSDDTDNLLFREADIAVRMYRPEQLDVITRKVGAQKFGIFATREYLDQAGRPSDMAGIFQHDFIGYDRSDLMIKEMRLMGIPAERSMFAIRCDNQSVYLELLRAGCGLGVAPLNIASMDPSLERVLPDIKIPELPIWLTAHEALRSAPRIRRVFDILADGLAKVAPAAA
jgi:molybdate transport repressor ModE-like protein